MAKKEEKPNLLNPLNILKTNTHPALSQKLTIGQKASDHLTKHLGSWAFIILFMFFLLVWMLINTYYLIIYLEKDAFDPFPFILLNLILSCLASIQAPIILMSQNRQSQKDRVRAEYDYAVNRKSEKEIEEIKKQLNRIEKKLS